jgi:tripartite-type tricarboxylate transporter receptor subunit TctC
MPLAIRRSVAAIGAIILIASSARAQTYPSKPVHIIVPYAAGGITDIIARALGARLTEALKQQFIIENKPAGGGTVGPGEVAKAAPGMSVSVGAVWSCNTSASIVGSTWFTESIG